MFGTPRSNSQRREISEDRAKLEELRAKCKIREETYKIEIDKLRQKLDKIRYKFEQQHKYRQNSQEMQRIKDENLFLKQQVSYQKQQLQQSFQINNILQTSRETSATKRAQSSRSAHEKNQILNYNSSSSGSKGNNNGANPKKIIATDMELVKIAQHKLMKENKNLKKRVDVMSQQMKELYDLLLDEKLNSTQAFQTNTNIHQVMKALRQHSTNTQKSPIEQQDFNNDTAPFDQSLQQQNQFSASGISNIRVSGERNPSPLYQNANVTYGDVSEEQIINQGSNAKIDDLSQRENQNKKFNFGTSQNTNSDNNIKNTTLNMKSPQQYRGGDQIDQQQNEFSEKLEMTKSKFIDKIKNVFLKHQKQNEIFENNNKKMKEITRQLFEQRSKSKESKESQEKQNQQGDEMKIQTEESISNSVTSSVSSAFIVDKDTANCQNQKENPQVIMDHSDSSSSNELVLGDDIESTVELQQENNQNQRNLKNPVEVEYPQAVKKQMNFLMKDIEQESDEQISADFDQRKKLAQKQADIDKDNQKLQYSSKVNKHSGNQDSYFESSKLLTNQSGKGKTKSMQNELNIVSFNDTGQKNFKKESANKADEFRSLKEQFSSLMNSNVSNNTFNNLNNTTGLSTIANNYIQFSGYGQDGSQTTRKFDPLTQFQVPKNYPNLQYPGSSSSTNYNKQYNNANYPSSQITINQNYTNSLDFNKNQDHSGSLQSSNLLHKFNSNTSRNQELNYRNGKNFDLDFIGHSAQISPQKELTMTSRQRDEMQLNFPSSTQSQSLHVNAQKKENTNNNKVFESKLDNLNKVSKLTTPLISTQTEKITDEYIRQIIQQYKTPKKNSISSTSHSNQAPSYQQPSQQQQQNYNSTQQFMVPHQKKPSAQNQTHGYTYDRREILSSNQQGGVYSKQQPMTSRIYDKDTSISNQYSSFNQNVNQSHLTTGVAATSNINTQSSPNRYSKNTNIKMNVQSQTPTSTAINQNNINNSHNPSSYSKDLTIYNCYFNNNSPINKKITNIQPPLPGTAASSSSNTNRESLNLNHKRQQSCGGSGVSGVNKYNLKLNLTSLVTPKSSQLLQSDRQNSDRTGYNRLLSKNSVMVSSNISPKYSPHTSQTTSVNRLYQK